MSIDKLEIESLGEQGISQISLINERNCLHPMGQAHYNMVHVETYFVRLMGLDQFDVSPIRQWNPSGSYL